ncbi:antibiotic biosynthesis monooxygenase [Saxibacter everestensis]|uniref:Antibiotic biosynthesis monooxygenase n=1 Tax=Saxibacter everestensis TaxID=2909229 RepID=A0ABY8QR03_9MICO|nr:antibiotic biosynthesis monooxygenase [Brevibacteriaceae bacterium ZFBP1038]
MSTFHQVIAHYYVKDGEARRVLALLAGLAAASRAEPANLSYDYYQGVEDPNHIVILERYVDAAGFAAHRESEHFRSIGFEQIIPLLETRQVEEYTA